MTRALAEPLRPPLQDALDVIATGNAEARLIYNPSREVDSFAEHLIVELRRHSVPDTVTRKLLGELRAILQLNARQGHHARQAAGALDRVIAALHDARDAQARDKLTIRGLVRALRDPLTTLTDGDATQRLHAQRDVRRIAARVPAERLRSESLRHNLGARRHDLLLSVIDLDREAA